jgi:hypothetical protein
LYYISSNSLLFWWIDSEKNNMILIFSAKWNNFRGENIFSNYFDYDEKLEIIYINGDVSFLDLSYQ